MSKHKVLKVIKFKFLVFLVIFCEITLLFPFKSNVSAEELNNYLYPQKQTLNKGYILHDSINTNFVNKPQPSTPEDIKLIARTNEEVKEKERDLSYAHRIDIYLGSKGSPMAGYGYKLVQVEKTYGVNPKLIIAISGVESNYCKINFAKFNCWGWFSGGNFINYADAIDKYAHYISSFYFTKGLYNPYSIGPIYCPGSSTWAPNVSMYMNQAYF